MLPLTIMGANASNEYNIGVWPTAHDKAELQVEKFNLSYQPTDLPISNETYELADVCVNGNVITCTTQVFGMTADVSLTIGDKDVTITVSHIIFAPEPTVIPVDAKTIARARTWLAAQKFPQGTAS